MQWFRFYTEAIGDKKLTRAARDLGQPLPHVLGVWAVVLSIASDSPERGVLLIADGMPATIDDVNDTARCNVTETFLKLIETGLVTESVTRNGSIVYSIPAWGKRQFGSDDSSSRVKAHRERQKQAKTGQSAVTETLQPRYGNAPEADTDTDTDLNTSSGGGGVRPAPAPPVGVTLDPDYAAVADAYHNAGFGTLSVVLADTLKEYLADYGRVWTEDAIATAARSGKLNLNYVGGILRRWKANGKDTPASTPHTNGNGYSNGNGNGYRMSPADRTRAAFEEVERMLAEQEEQERKAQGKGTPE